VIELWEEKSHTSPKEKTEDAFLPILESLWVVGKLDEHQFYSIASQEPHDKNGVTMPVL
jgi:hypothetical protein